MNGVPLQPGDILVFEAESGWISKAIALLTNSTVSHSALVIADGMLVEMSLEGGIDSYPFFYAESGEMTPNSRFVYAMRHTVEQLDMAPVVAAAHQYLEAKTAYNMPLLVLLGGLLVYRRIPFTNASWPFVKVVLRHAASALNAWLENRRGKQAMTCSQLVYQCYLDCGEAYAVQLEDGDLQQGYGLCLAERPGADKLAAAEPEAPMMDLTEAFGMDFLTTIAADGLEQVTPPGDVLAAAARFKTASEQLARESGAPLEAIFVTPADLLHHAVNLRKIGAMRIAWDDEF